MQIDFRQVIKGLDGKPVLDETQKPVTLGVACEMALMRNAPAGPGEPELTGDKKVHYMTLAQDIHVKGKVDVISDDIVLLKKLVGLFPAEGSAVYMPSIFCFTFAASVFGGAALIAGGSMLADIADRQTGRTADERRFYVDVERARLGILELKTVVESDRIMLEDLGLEVQISGVDEP